MQKLTIFIFLFNFIIKFNLSIIIIPFRTYNPLLSKDEKIINLIKKANDLDIVDTLSKNLIYTNLSIGEVNNIQTFISMESTEFYLKNLALENKTSPEDIIGYPNYTYNDNYLLKNLFTLNYYNSSLSKSYKYVSAIEEDYYDIFSFDKGVYANETFFLKKEKEIIRPINLMFTYRQSVRFDQRPGVIGLSIGKNDLIYQLKRDREINNYEFNIKYSDINEEKGEIIIGESPHIYDRDNFNENDLRSAQAIKDYYWKWTLQIARIYIPEFNFMIQKNQLATFKIEEFFIEGTKEYFDIIQNIFFNKYIDEKICFIQTHKKSRLITKFYHFMCYIKDDNKRKEFFSNFPSLIIYQKEMNCNFTFDHTVLFTIIPDSNRILFNIEFDNESQKWVFGKPFFKKYQLVFDLESKLIKYYIRSNIKNNLNNTNNDSGKIIFIVFLVIIVFVMGVLFGKALCTKYNRKLRANELEDEFSYTAKNVEEQNDMKNM